MFIRAGMCVFLATATGFAVGIGLGALLSFVTWGLSMFVGVTVGTTAGGLAGVLVAADSSGRFGGGGQWIGVGIGVAVVTGLVAYAAVYGPGVTPASGGDLLFLLGLLVFGGGTGFASGRLAEQVGRAVTDV